MNLDAPQSRGTFDRGSKSDTWIPRFSFVETAAKPNPTLLSIVKELAPIGPGRLTPVGRFPHFRRIRPESWPRSLHYEILVGDAGPSVEIHLESDEVASIGKHLAAGVNQIANAFPGRSVQWNDYWWGQGRGRIRISYRGRPSAAQVSRDVSLLFDLTFNKLDSLAKKITF